MGGGSTLDVFPTIPGVVGFDSEMYDVGNDVEESMDGWFFDLYRLAFRDSLFSRSHPNPSFLSLALTVSPPPSAGSKFDLSGDIKL